MGMEITVVEGETPGGKSPADTGYAPARWEFDGEVTRVFDDMLARSIPQYDVMRRAVTDVAARFVRDGTDVVDLGCSRGEAMAPLVDRFGARCRFIGVEVSEPMLVAARERFAGYVKAGIVEIRDDDLRESYPPVKASVTLAVLTLMFVPIERRPHLVREAFKHTLPGGAFVIVEKILGSTAEIDELMVDVYHGMKVEHGYAPDEVERKRLSLQGVLVPVTARWCEDMLRAQGFAQVDCFWRWMNFAAWVAIKE